MKLPVSYTDYLRAVEHYRLDDYAGHFVENPGIQERIIQFHKGFNDLMPGLYVLDLTRRKYLYVNQQMEQLTGVRNEALLEGGTEFGLTLWHKADLEIFSRNIFLDNLRILRSTAATQRDLLHFECNYRITPGKGERKSLLQQSAYIATSETGMPLVSMGVLTDISHLRRDSRIFHVVSKRGSPIIRQQNKVLHNESYFSDEQQQKLSTREVEVLKWICEGVDSKTIAKKLCISPNTVNNHRRHIIAKTGCKSSLALYKYAINHGFL